MEIAIDLEPTDTFPSREPASLPLAHQLISALSRSPHTAFEWEVPEHKLYLTSLLVADPAKLLLDVSQWSQSGSFSSVIHDEDIGRFRSHLHTILTSKEARDMPCKLEVRMRPSVRTWRWIEIRGRVVARNDLGLATHVVGTISDIDEQKQHEHALAKLRDLHSVRSQVNQAIARTTDPNLLFPEVCRALSHHRLISRSVIWLLDAANGKSNLAASHGKCFVSLRAPRTEDQTLPEIHNNILGESSSFISTEDELSARDPISAGRFWFSRSGKPYGCFDLFAEEVDFFDTEAITLTNEIAHDISFALDRQEREIRRRAAEAELVKSERLKSAILTAALDCIVSIDHEGNIISVNHAAALMFGYRSEDIIGKKLADVMIPPEWRERHRQGLERFNRTETSNLLNRRIELTALHADGRRFPIELAIVPLAVDHKPVFTAFIRDISERKRAEALQEGQSRILNMIANGVPLSELLDELAHFVEQHSDGILCSIHQIDGESGHVTYRAAPSLPFRLPIPDLNGVTATANETFARRSIPLTFEPLQIIDIANNPAWEAYREPILRLGLQAYTSCPILGKDDKRIGNLTLYIRGHAAPSPWELRLAAQAANLAATAIESRVAEEKIRRLAHYDGLTGLPNRFLFSEYLDIALRSARRHAKKFAIFFVDLDQFKEINDKLGHDAGDQVLREIAARLRGSLRLTDQIARMGGDEFYVLIEELADSSYVADVAQKLLDAVVRPISVGEEMCFLSTSIGIAIYPDDGHNGQELLRNADSAMYRAKGLGKNAYQFYGSACTPIQTRHTSLPSCRTTPQ